MDHPLAVHARARRPLRARPRWSRRRSRCGCRRRAGCKDTCSVIPDLRRLSSLIDAESCCPPRVWTPPAAVHDGCRGFSHTGHPHSTTCRRCGLICSDRGMAACSALLMGLPPPADTSCALCLQDSQAARIKSKIRLSTFAKVSRTALQGCVVNHHIRTSAGPFQVGPGLQGVGLRALAAAVLCRFGANMKSRLSKMSPNLRQTGQNRLNFAILVKSHQECSTFGSNAD